MTIVFFWVALSVVVAVAANTRDRNGVGWFFLALLISPLIAGLLVLALPKPPDTDIRACPFCAEPVKVGAIVCRHCARDLPVLTNPTATRTDGSAIQEAPKPPIPEDIGHIVVPLIVVAIFGLVLLLGYCARTPY